MAHNTALQILFEELEKLVDVYSDAFKEFHLAKERQQIIDAWNDGKSIGCVIGSNDYTNETEQDNGAYYYTNTFNQ